MKIAITGTTGLVGINLVNWFRHNKTDIIRLVRPETHAEMDSETVLWDYKNKQIESAKIEGCDVVIHLAGANIAAKRWNKNYKDEIYNSRIQSTKFLSETLASLKIPPKVFMSASAIGFYGNHSSENLVDENSGVGRGFLPDVCQEWEKATEEAIQKGIRVLHLRFGTILSPRGGALAKMLPIFKYGFGGKLGSGLQYMSWVTLNEIPIILNWLIYRDDISGPVNIVTPQAVSNFEFTKTLGEVVRRPAIFPVPRLAVKTLFGEMGQELLLEGANIQPRKLIDKGYKFVFPELKKALNVVLN